MGDSDEQKKLIQDWLAVNPGTEDEARFYLEVNNWDLNAALSNFYEAPPMSEGLPLQNQEDSTLPQDPTDEPATVNAGPIRAAPTAAPISSTPANTSVPRRRYGPGARIATLSSLNSQDNDHGEKSVDQPQEWYAGGERSGMAVQPPPKPEGGSLVDRIMRRALEERAAGGSSFPPSFSPEQQQSNPIIFTGRGQTESNEPDDDEGEIAVRNITFWRNGFSIGDNAFYNTEDPANRHILESILQGRAPQGIFNVKNGQRVEMRVTDRHGEDYVSSPPSSSQPFSGQGRRLGGIVPSVDTTVAAADPLMGSSTSSSNENPIELDSDQPTVQIQIRLADGSRLIAKVNPSHTIGHLRAFVLSQRPDAAGSRPFVFKVVMPPKVLDDDSATIKDTGIANAAIAQHFV